MYDNIICILYKNSMFPMSANNSILFTNLLGLYPELDYTITIALTRYCFVLLHRLSSVLSLVFWLASSSRLNALTTRSD